MRAVQDQTLSRLAQADHGVLSTVHHERGVDAVPVVYAVSDQHLAIPVDTVKPKASTRLQRVRNLEADPRATLLVDHWDRDDWSQLWWIRAHLRYIETPHQDARAMLEDLLVERYEQYASRPFADVLVFDVIDVAEWSAS